ncbi:MAG: ABC-2 transporter permease [Clostridiales bacterium]|jgi:ABC-2 type transport system permease protein|uniref:ABC-2 transporter permease n=1 Tax=Clostridia TaxID=186801 RepID=UPI0018AC431B|nr:ABC-2 transporter permease [Clostridium sp. 1001270J_160509_D11]MDU1202155.1 ABC-2 transporter permease [Clostridiales bacterium]
MKGLLIKDILNMKNYMKQLVLVLIFFIAYGIFLKNGTFVGTMITLMLSMQVITTMSYDEYAKWDKYALTMNINRKDIIISKYIFFTISIIIGIVVGITTSIAINQIAKLDTGMNEIIVTSIVVPCVFAILFSIIIPVVFKTGVEKGRIVMMLILFIPAILVGAIVKISEKANITMPSPSNLEILMKFGVLGLVLLTILAVFISYKVSLSIYNKKEF